MDATLELTHERVDAVPLLLVFLIRLRLPEALDRHLPPHPLHQGLSNGWLITVWIAYILSQADHRKSHVRVWVDGLHHTLESLIGQTIRPVEFSDDRFAMAGHGRFDPLARRGPAVGPGHRRIGSRLVDEDQPPRKRRRKAHLFRLT